MESDDVISSQLRQAADAIPQEFQKSNLVEEIQALVAAYSSKAVSTERA